MYYLNKCILKITITLMIGVSLTTQVFAQSSNIEKTILSEGISVIVIESGGETTIRQTALSEIKIASSLSASGKVYGAKLGNTKRPKFELQTLIKNDTLFIKMPSEFTYSSIGVNLYSETVQNQLILPAHIRLIVRKAEHVILDTELSYVDIKSAKKVRSQSLELDHYSVVYCEPKTRLKIGGKTKSTFMHKGEGEKILMIKSDYIKIN